MNNIKKETKDLKNTRNANRKVELSLIKYYSKIEESNTIAEELNRRIRFVPFVASIDLIDDNDKDDEDKELIVKIKVLNNEDGWVNYWSLEKFEERL